ncbi:MAG: oligopeptide/dipeptide ABC transporter ATP-binding protein, partial [Sciscionella sp.]
VATVFRDPRHPYTQALLSAIPIPDPDAERAKERIILTGDIPSPANPPSGCRFRTRCFTFAALPEQRKGRCVEQEPLREPDGTDHEFACHYPTEKAR